MLSHGRDATKIIYILFKLVKNEFHCSVIYGKARDIISLVIKTEEIPGI